MTKTNSSAIDNNRVSTALLAKNIKFLYRSSNAINPNTSKKYTYVSYLGDILGISENTVSNWSKEDNFVAVNSIRSLNRVVEGVNDWIDKDETLKKWFPNSVVADHLLGVDFVKYTLHPPYESQNAFYIEKIIGTYLCYYNVTQVDATKNKIHYGVMQIIESNGRPGECSCKGVFAINDFKEAKRIHTDIVEKQEIMENVAPYSVVFKGKAYVNRDFIWVNLSNETKSEFVAMSFDIDPKVLEKNPYKPFKGVRGLALSQSTGSGMVSVEFPMAIKKTPISPSKNEIRKHLTLPHKKLEENSDAVKELAANLFGLFNSFPAMSLSDELRFKLVTRLLVSGFESIIEANVSNTCYYSHEDSNIFYHEIILPEDDE